MPIAYRGDPIGMLTGYEQAYLGFQRRYGTIPDILYCERHVFVHTFGHPGPKPLGLCGLVKLGRDFLLV